MAVRIAVRGERPGWLNLRTVFGLLLFLASSAWGWMLLDGVDRGTRLWAAASDLPAGVPLRSSDLVAVTSELGQQQLSVYLGAGTNLEGAELTRPVGRGELLVAGFVAPSEQGSAARAITVPITSDHAVGGDLSPGDRVDVYATLGGSRGAARTTLVVSSAQVLDLVTAGGLISDGESLIGLTLEVSADDAARLAFAIRSGDVDIVKLTGDQPTSPGGSVSASDL